jgi:hypothetical protein
MEIMRPGILDYPFVFAIVILVMSILDEILSVISRRLYFRGHNRFYTYVGSGRRIGFRSKVYRWFIRVSVPVMLVVIFFLGQLLDEVTIQVLYYTFAGFAFFNYLIIDLRHLENILLYKYTESLYEKGNFSELQGEITIGRGFSLRQSSYQIFTIMILLFGVFIFHPSYFMMGGLIAPLLISVRNLILSGAIAKQQFRTPPLI